MILNFQVNQNMFFALASGDCRPLVTALKATRKHPSCRSGGCSCAATTSSISAVCEDAAAEVFEQFGPEPAMQLYGRGIRRRIASMLGGDPRRLELASSLLFSLPGTPVMRYGDEIGMGDDQSLPDRKAVRTPMQWTADDKPRASPAPRRPSCPRISNGPFGYRQINVADQRRDPASLLNLNERFIRMRKECPEFGWGDHEELPTRSPNVLAVRCHWRNNAVLTVHNFSAEAREVTLEIPGAENLPLTNLLLPEQLPPSPHGRHQLTLPPYGYRWYRVGPLLDVATREPR